MQGVQMTRLPENSIWGRNRRSGRSCPHAPDDWSRVTEEAEKGTGVGISADRILQDGL
jgi:hypothetical protein